MLRGAVKRVDQVCLECAHTTMRERMREHDKKGRMSGKRNESPLCDMCYVAGCVCRRRRCRRRLTRREGLWTAVYAPVDQR